jgi:hypothetical protein
MVALIEFLMRNWYLVFIIVGIFSWLRNANVHMKQNGTPTNRMPSFGGQPVSRQQPDAKKSQTLIEFASTSQAPKELLLPENREKTASPFSVPAGSFGYSRRKESTENAEVSISTDTLSAGKKQLAQGIIWAEILGPPRAKKPYRRV